MNRISYVLFGIMILGFGVSLYLYNQARKGSIEYNDRVIVVNRVLLLLERTEHLKNILRKTIFESLATEDSGLLFTSEDKSEVDSIMNLLHQIVLYDEQRLRVDTIKRIINSNYKVLLGKDHGKSAMDYDPANTEVIARAKAFAKMQLRQQQEDFERFQSNANFWATSILLLSSMIFLVVKIE